jgi:hypothetical protein
VKPEPLRLGIGASPVDDGAEAIDAAHAGWHDEGDAVVHTGGTGSHVTDAGRHGSGKGCFGFVHWTSQGSGTDCVGAPDAAGGSRGKKRSDGDHGADCNHGADADGGLDGKGNAASADP